MLIEFNLLHLSSYQVMVHAIRHRFKSNASKKGECTLFAKYNMKVRSFLLNSSHIVLGFNLELSR